MANDFETQEFYTAVNTFAEDLVTDIKDQLRRYHGNPSNGDSQDTGLAGSIELITPYYKDGSLFIDIKMDDYWYFLEYGRGKTKVGKSKKPFEQTLAGKLYASGWYRKTGVDPREWYKAKLKNPEKSKILKDFNKLKKMLSIAIARNIHKKGWTKYPKGSKFLTKATNPQKMDLFAENIGDIIGQKIVLDLSNSILKTK